jgi:(1->4)-alpha-D-glucan 1-alpha-D-glucosylmutase
MDYEADQGRGADIDPGAGRSVDAAATNALFERTRVHVLQPGRVPLATYRVQLHKGFDFAQAMAIVPYLARLGVSHFYASPVLKALPGSNHGYDVIDHQRVNDELGGEVGYAAFCDALSTHRLRQVLDTVPNHMGIERGNLLWEEVLENGPASAQAHVFDIEWEPVKAELRGKVLLPVLGDQYGVVLDRGELQLEYVQGSFSLLYFDRRFPINPRAYQDILEPGVERLVAQLGEAHPDATELRSILTGLRNLPTRRDTTPEKVAERGREKEVLKRRLNALVSGSSAVAEHVRTNVDRLNGHPGDPRSFDALDRLLDRYCPYRLAHWRVAGEEINYRRFFDINSLAAIRVEDEDVFEEAHRLVFQFLAAGQVQGLRIDHPDGLFDPSAYFLRLQERYFLDQARRLAGVAEDHPDWANRREALRRRWREQVATDTSSPLRKALYLVVEKIQGGKERIPDDWAVHGTTGYRFANLVTGVLVDTGAEREFTDIYRRFSGQNADFATVLVEKKKQVMAVSMASEINGLARELNRISELNRRTRDFTLNSIRRALIGFIAHFPVYRTYVSGEPGVDERDAHYIQWTIARARVADPTTNASLFQWLQDVLLKRYPEDTSPVEREVMLHFAMKLQQLSGPVMAKALEDTVFYVYNRLMALNEVGGEPEHFGTSVEGFHHRNLERVRTRPGSLLTTSTHDTKRSGDVRARLAVLTELPGDWRRSLDAWSRLNALHKTHVSGELAPSANDEYLYYQTLLGAWPMGEPSRAEMESFRIRLREYMLKAIREAKVHTSWTNPDPDYEEATVRFVDRTLDPTFARVFFEQARRFKERLERPGQVNSLVQTALQLTCPGVPDVYQGTELWDLSLVDPDNRRPVDFELRERLLSELLRQHERDPLTTARVTWQSSVDGRCKLLLVAVLLRLRQARPRLFQEGGYEPLELDGIAAARALALARRLEDQAIVVVAPRLVVRAMRAGLGPVYGTTRLRLPTDLAGRRFRHVVTGARVQPLEGGIALGPILSDFPVAVLEAVE